MIALAVSALDQTTDLVVLNVVGLIDDDKNFRPQDVVEINASRADLQWDCSPGYDTPLAGRVALWDNRAFTVKAAYEQNYAVKLVLGRDVP